MGCVIHKVTAGVDEGKVLEEDFNAWRLQRTRCGKLKRDLFIMVNFLRKDVGFTK